MSTTAESRTVPWYLWPFWAIWRLLACIVTLTGRLIAVVLGLALMVIGALVSLTVIGAVIGVPIILIGFLLVLRGFF